MQGALAHGSLLSLETHPHLAGNTRRAVGGSGRAGPSPGTDECDPSNPPYSLHQIDHSTNTSHSVISQIHVTTHSPTSME